MDKNWILENAEEKYREFVTPLTNTTYKIYGVRIPTIKKYAKEKAKKMNTFKVTKPECFEEAMFDAIVISSINLNIDKKFNLLELFLPYIDNWAVCDSFCASFKVTIKNEEKVYQKILEYVKSDHEFTIRVGLILLNDYYIKAENLKNIFDIVSLIKSDFYYVLMAESWLLSTCFIKFPNQTFELFENYKFEKFVINTAVQKIRDSKRVSKELKDKVLKFKIKHTSCGILMQ